jgi:SAM-dependent methyltransferase
MLRVLAPGGRAVFLEPLGHNPLLWLYRRLTREERTRDERPLRMQDVEALAAKFSAARHTEFGFTTLGLVVLRVLLRRPRLWPRLLNLLSAADRTLAELLPFIREFYWVTVIELER